MNNHRHHRHHVDRTVGTNVRSSLAAERALNAGEEVEDTLWMGSGRLDGSNVRRQLLNSRSQKSRRFGSSQQRLLQSMRFWESLRPNSKNSSGAANADTSSRGRSSRATNNKFGSNYNPTSNRRTNNQLEYNGGNPTSTRMLGLTTTTLAANVNPLGSLLSTPRHEEVTRRGEFIRLLSMRCEASRSMRPRAGNMMQRLMEEPDIVAATREAVTNTIGSTLEAAQNIKQRHNNGGGAKGSGRPPFLRSHKNTTAEQQPPEQSRPTKDSTGDSPNTRGKRGRENNKQSDKPKKLWFGWLPKPSNHELEDTNKLVDLRNSSAASLPSHQDDDGDETLPAHVQLAKSQKRGDSLHQGSRHLGQFQQQQQHTNASSDDSKEFGGDTGGGGHATTNTNTKFGTTRSSHHQQHYKPMHTSNNPTTNRSTRFGVHSNQPLLVRCARVGNLGDTMEDDDDDDDDTVDTVDRSSVRNCHTQNSRNIDDSNTIRQVRINEPKSGGSLLVNQLSGLSAINLNPGSEADDGAEIFATVQDLLDSTRAQSASTEFSASTMPNSITTTSSSQQQQQQRGMDPDGSRLHYWFEDEDIGGDCDEKSGSLSLRHVPKAASYFMQKQAGEGHLQCLEEEEEGAGGTLESEHKSGHYGPDQSFGRAAMDSSLSSLMKLKKKDSESSSQDSKINNYFDSQSFHGRDSKTSSTSSDSLHFSQQHCNGRTINYKQSRAVENSGSQNSFQHQDLSDTNSNHASGHRLTLPANALGSRQKALRGGLMSECAEECRTERRNSSLPSTPSPTQEAGGSNNDGLGAEVTLPSKYQNPLRGGYGNGKDNSPLTSSRDPPTQNSPDTGDGDEGGCEMALRVQTRDSGREDWWPVDSDDGNALQNIPSFCSNLYGACDDQGIDVDAFDDDVVCYDARSVASEPADSGLGEPLVTEEDMTDPSQNRWLFAWDDLALL